MELQGMGQREIKPHPCRGLPAEQHNAKPPFSSGQAERAHGESSSKTPARLGAPREQTPSAPHTSPRNSCQQRVFWRGLGLHVVPLKDTGHICIQMFEMPLFGLEHNRREWKNTKKPKQNIYIYTKKQTKKEEENGRERNIWWEIFPVLAEPTNPQDHPGYKWKHAKKKRGNAFHRAVTFHLSALEVPGCHFQNLYKNSFYPQFSFVMNHFLLAIYS